MYFTGILCVRSDQSGTYLEVKVWRFMIVYINLLKFLEKPFSCWKMNLWPSLKSFTVPQVFCPGLSHMYSSSMYLFPKSDQLLSPCWRKPSPQHNAASCFWCGFFFFLARSDLWSEQMLNDFVIWALVLPQASWQKNIWLHFFHFIIMHYFVLVYYINIHKKTSYVTSLVTFPSSSSQTSLT